MRSLKFFYQNLKLFLFLRYQQIMGYGRRILLKNRDFSIISNNCWGGFISKYYALPYNSPTCGILFLGDDYINFCKKLKYYISQELQFIKFEDSKFSYHVNPFPVAKLDDIEIGFMHYKSENEAEQKWKRRAARINWDNLIFKISHRDEFTEEHINAFSELPYPHKLIFAEKDFGEKTIITPGINTLIGEETPLTLQMFNVTKYLNSLKDKGYKIRNIK